jgi:hypothetical protein
MGFLNALRGAGPDAMRESASLTTAYLLEQNRKFEAFMREKIAQLESRVTVQHSRLSLKSLEAEAHEDEPEWPAGDGRAEAEASYPDAWDMVDFRDVHDLAAGKADQVTGVDDMGVEPTRAAASDERDAASEARPEPPDWMTALIGAPASQPQAEAPEAESPAVEVQEEAVEVQSPQAHGEEVLIEMPEESMAEPSADGEEALAPSPAEEAECLPPAEAIQPSPVEQPPDAGQVWLESEEQSPDAEASDALAGGAFVSPWLWSTVKEEAPARPMAGLNALPGQSPLVESIPGASRLASVQPDPAVADDLEDDDGGWEGALPQEPPGAWA